MARRSPVRAWIGLGSNIGDGRAEIARALQRLALHPELSLCRQSSLYRSAAWGEPDQPDFYNAVAEFETRLEPQALLDLLLETEAALGRVRDGQRWGPRRIDLDLLLMGDAQLARPGLSLPHPRMHLRAFVLLPLAEIEPGLQIPGRGSVSSCLGKLENQRVEAVEAPG